MRTTFACAVLTLVLGCDDACRGDLSEVCSDCPKLEQRDAQIRAEILAENWCHYAVSGTCGDLQFIVHSNGYTGSTYYFDASGELVGITNFSDYNQFCDGDAFSKEFGSVPDCEQVVAEDLCELVSQNG